MGQIRSKPLPSSLVSNSCRRLSDSDCLHLLSHPEYFDNQLINIEQTKSIRKSGSISTFLDEVESSFNPPKESLFQSKVNQQNVAVRMSCSTAPLYRNSMYPGCMDHHQENCIQENIPVQCVSRPKGKCSPSQSPLPPFTARIRPISMFTFDSDNEAPKQIVSATPSESPLKQIENLNFSLNDLLEQINATESVRHTVRLGHSSSIHCSAPRQVDDDSRKILMSEHEGSEDVIEDIHEENISDDNVKKKQEQMVEKEEHQQCHQIPIRCSGLDCMCDRCIHNRFKLLNWLLPNCTRMNSERLLSGKPDGTFLVRKSEKFPGQYTLSFVCRRAVRHCLIMRSVYGFGLRWPYSFETLQQVIVHYSRHSLTEFNSKLNIHLKYPVFSA